jgi:hypothetical protein
MEVSGDIHAVAILNLGKNTGAHWIGSWTSGEKNL